MVSIGCVSVVFWVGLGVIWFGTVCDMGWVEGGVSDLVILFGLVVRGVICVGVLVVALCEHFSHVHAFV